MVARKTQPGKRAVRFRNSFGLPSWGGGFFNSMRQMKEDRHSLTHLPSDILYLVLKVMEHTHRTHFNTSTTAMNIQTNVGKFYPKKQHAETCPSPIFLACPTRKREKFSLYHRTMNMARNITNSCEIRAVDVHERSTRRRKLHNAFDVRDGRRHAA